MANKDLRNWLEDIKANGELHTITGAEPKEEIGGIVDIVQRKMGNPALMFDEVPGFPKGFRVLSNILTSIVALNIINFIFVFGNNIYFIKYNNLSI
mgnify:CR=1 FL=1